MANNPYSATIGAQHTAGLTSVVTAIGAGPTTLAVINTKTSGYTATTLYPGVTILPVLQNELDSIAIHGVNNYINPVANNFNGIQMQFSNMLLNTIICGVPVESIGDFILDVEDNVTKSGLSVEEQIPLMMATAVGKANYDYLMTAVATPANIWYTNGYFNAKDFANRASLPYWVQSAMMATLNNASKAKSYGLIDPPQIAGVDMITTVAASVGVCCAKIMLKLIPRIQPMGGSMKFPGSCC